MNAVLEWKLDRRKITASFTKPRRTRSTDRLDLRKLIDVNHGVRTSDIGSLRPRLDFARQNSVFLRYRDFLRSTPDEKRFVQSILDGQHAISRNLLFTGTDSAEAVKAFGNNWNGAVPYTVLFDANGESSTGSRAA